MLTAIELKMLNSLKNGEVIIYPTDTIYGIGCDAFNTRSIEKIFEIKKRDPSKPVSLLFSGIEDVEQKFYTEKNGRKIDLNKYVNGYTLLLKPKPWIEKVDAHYFYKNGNIGVRIIDHWVSKVVEKLGNPIITTSANISNSKRLPIDYKSIDQPIINGCDAIFYEGKLKSKASIVLDPLKNKTYRK